MLAKVVSFVVLHHEAIMVSLGVLVALARLLFAKHAEAIQSKAPKLYAAGQAVAAIAPDVVPAAKAIGAAWKKPSRGVK
jgi:predicted lipoprotein